TALDVIHHATLCVYFQNRFAHRAVALILFAIKLYFHFFFFNVTPTPEIYTLSLHDALPISVRPRAAGGELSRGRSARSTARVHGDRKSTRLNSSHRTISYAVFCLKKKKCEIRYVPVRDTLLRDHITEL